MVGAVKGHILHQRTKFRKGWSNYCGDMAIFVNFKTAATAVLDFQKFEILTIDPLQEANMRHSTKSYQNRSNGCRDIAI